MRMSPASTRRRPLRAALATITCVVLTSCSDGYPTEDVPQIEPSRMTAAELVAALNELGAGRHLDQRWRYRLEGGCQLEVRARNGGAVHHRVRLTGASIEVRAEDGVFDVRVIPEDAPPSDAATVLETQRWPDSVRARSLLMHLTMRCTGPAEPPARGVATPAPPAVTPARWPHATPVTLAA